MTAFHEQLKNALGGVVPLGLRDAYSALVKGKIKGISIPYEYFKEDGKLDKFINSPGVEFQDGETGVYCWGTNNEKK